MTDEIKDGIALTVDGLSVEEFTAMEDAAIQADHERLAADANRALAGLEEYRRTLSDVADGHNVRAAIAQFIDEMEEILQRARVLPYAEKTGGDVPF